MFHTVHMESHTQKKIMRAHECITENKYLTLFYVAVGLYDTHSLEWPFLLKFLCTKIVKQCVFLVQSIVFQHMLFLFMKQ